jgi:hypothetical protein
MAAGGSDNPKGPQGPAGPTVVSEPDFSTRRLDRGERWATSIAGPRLEDREHVLVRRFTLLVTAGPDAGRRVASAGDRLAIGTHPAAELALTDDTVSRFHCDITVSGKLVVLRDLESGNGTIVDGVSVLVAHLRGGSVLTLGRTQLRFDTGGEPVRLALSGHDAFGRLAGGSAAMRRVFAELERAAADPDPLLLEGEVGTGKATAAEAVHRESDRRDEPLVTLTCAAAFGAGDGSALAGALASAGRGTLYLDEVGELAPADQARLRAALADRPAARAIAGTSRDLMLDVNAGRFDAELYELLARAHVRLPPLRARLEDLRPLVTSLLEALGVDREPAAQPLAARDFLVQLARRAWPGNVGELRRLLRRCLALLPAIGAQGALGELPPDADVPLARARQAWELELERRYLEALVAEHGDDLPAAARAAGLNPGYLTRLLALRRPA